MFSKNQPNVYSLSIYLYYHLKILALLPHSINGPVSKGNFFIKIRDKIFTILSLVITASLFLTTKAQDHVSSVVLTTIWELNSHNGRLTMLFLVCYQYWKSDKIVDILKMLNEFDEKVRSRFGGSVQILLYIF